MSVAVISIQPSYHMEPYISPLLSNSDNDSDAGYQTPAKNVLTANEASLDLEKSADGSGSDSADGSGSDSAEVGTVVNSDLQEKILKQVEWYFSDENLLKDSFMMKHINRNKQGYVSLKLVASLRKVKTITKDWKIVLESLKHSNLLVLNEEKTKIRRKTPAPQVDFTHITKTLIITDYPQENPNLADLEQQFGRYGEVTQVRIIYPGRAVPLDVKPCKTHHPSLGKDLCILVEYVSTDVAKASQKRIKEQQSWRDEMKIHLLGDKKSVIVGQETKEQEGRTIRTSNEGKKKKESKSPEVQYQSVSQKGRPHSKDNSFTSSRLSTGKDHYSSRGSGQNKISPLSDTRRRWKHQGGKSSSSELSQRYLHPETDASDSGYSCGSRSASESPKMTPEPSRKFFSGTATDFSWRLHSHMNSCVIRQPMGPDGTKGFSKHRISPISIAIQSC